jgi:hypothetical protein
MDAIDVLLTNLAGAIRTLTVLGARVQLSGEDVSNDIAWTGAATYGTGGGSHFESAQYFNFIGRSALGRRVRVAVFGAGVEELGTDYRASTGETAAVDDNVAFLNGLSTEFVAIDGAHPAWKAYANMGPNAHWRNKIR